MNPVRLFAILTALWVSSTLAFATRGDTSYEQAVQYSLEHLVSGASTEFLADGDKVTVMPVRSWKSVSGHYCRQFETTFANATAAAGRIVSIRCRDDDGVWKRVTED
ncbi:MAG: hypothetical protein ACE5EU_06065 [Paracoccaceae bacterium]